MARVRDEKKHEAYSLSLRGYSVAEIAEYVGVVPATVRSWLEGKKVEVSETLRNVNSEDYSGAVLTRFGELRKELWLNYNRATKDNDRRGLLKLLMDLENKEIKAMQELGVLNPITQEHNHTVNGVVGHAVMPQGMTGATLEALSAMLASNQLDDVDTLSMLKLGGRFGDPERRYLEREAGTPEKSTRRLKRPLDEIVYVDGEEEDQEQEE